MKFTDDKRVPWWGLLIEGGVEVVAPLVASAVAEAAGDLVVVPGNGWTGLLSLRHDEPHRTLADALRLTGREVMILEWGEPESFVWRWDGTAWDMSEENPSRLAETRGVYGPGSGRGAPGRPVRSAALIEGVPIEEVVAAVAHKEHAIATPRGPVVIEEEGVTGDFADRAGVTVYQVTRFLDTDELMCTVMSLDKCAVFGSRYVAEAAQIPILADVEGETEPRAIVRRLCLPEAYLFPVRSQ